MLKQVSIMLFVPVMLSTVFASVSPGESGRWTPFEFGTLDLVEPEEPIQIFGKDASVYGLRLSLFHAHNNNIGGIDFGPLGYNRVENNMTGLQAGAGVNRVGGRLRGLQTAGVANVVAEGRSLGIQLAAGGNYAYRLAGPQVSGALNMVNQTLTGFQITGGVNWAGEFTIPSFQLSGLGNACGELTGLQASGGINYGNKYRGLQLTGGVNIAGELKGLQITGIFNRAVDMRGVQLGLINYAESLRGVQIGAINVVGDAQRFPVLPIINASF